MDGSSIETAFMVIGLISSLAALVLAVIAIWLSIVFFKMSSTLATSTTEVAKGLGAGVERLEKLFDKLYADTFSMMKDTVSDMRKHIWPDDQSTDADLTMEIENKADEKVSELKNEVDAELSKLLRSQRVTEANIDSLRTEMRELIDRAISMSRSAEVEARVETIRDHIMQALKMFERRRLEATAINLVRHMKDQSGRVVQELKSMQEEGLLSLDGLGSDGNVLPNTKIHLF